MKLKHAHLWCKSILVVMHTWTHSDDKSYAAAPTRAAVDVAGWQASILGDADVTVAINTTPRTCHDVSVAQRAVQPAFTVQELTEYYASRLQGVGT